MLHSQGARRIRKAAKAATTPLHPASRILIYLLAALAIPGLPFFVLLILLLVPLLSMIWQRRAPLRLVWRSRWLLLVLLFGYAYSLPGEPLLPLLGSAAPSWEGGLHGVGQVLRLIALLFWLDMLVLRLPADALLTGLYSLMRPISLIGLDPCRTSLRLGLTLRAIENLERGRGNLKALLKLDFQVDLPERIQLCTCPLRLIDVAVPGLVLATLLGVWVNAA